MLGDVSAGNKEHMEALTLAFSQTTAAGKLMGQDLLQYINAGFNPLQIIAEHTGKKMSDLKDAMSEGKECAPIDAISESADWYRKEEPRQHPQGRDSRDRDRRRR